MLSGQRRPLKDMSGVSGCSAKSEELFALGGGALSTNVVRLVSIGEEAGHWSKSTTRKIEGFVDPA